MYQRVIKKDKCLIYKIHAESEKGKRFDSQTK